MSTIPFYIITSDATSDILPVTCYLYNKYWRPEGDQQFTILGNHRPKVALPENFNFVRIKSENNIQKWTRYIYDYISQHEFSPRFIITLDDYLPNAPLQKRIVQELFVYGSDRRVGRIALGRFTPTKFTLRQQTVEQWELLEGRNEYDIVRLLPDTFYRIACQTSIWDKEYFARYFNLDWTPWQLEIEGSKRAKHDGFEVVGTDRAWAFSWVQESALSGRWPGMINILGVRPEDVKYCIEQGWFDPKKLQYGIWYETRIPFLSRFQSLSKKLTRIPRFSDVGYNFSWSMIKPYVRSKTFKKLYAQYKDIYPLQ